MADVMNQNKGSYGKRKCKGWGCYLRQARHWLVILEPGPECSKESQVGTWEQRSLLTMPEELQGCEGSWSTGSKGEWSGRRGRTEGWGWDWDINAHCWRWVKGIRGNMVLFSLLLCILKFSIMQRKPEKLGSGIWTFSRERRYSQET